MINTTLELLKSWNNREGNVNSNKEILDWIDARNKNLKVEIKQVDFSYDGFWYYDEETGSIRNRNNSFFQLVGLQETENDRIVAEQPVIIQDEIGYLGIICKMIDGCLNFLMQAKIEPGNVNVIQISPTLQATKSNFLKKHGGKSPNYLEYFVNSKKHKILVDQIQSEQSSRFFKKRNRNIVILVNDDVPVLPSHKWMTLGQIKELLKIDNLVNMDTRTVLSCLRFNNDKTGLIDIANSVQDQSLFKSIIKNPDFDAIHRVFNYFNDYKMEDSRHSRFLPIKQLNDWVMTDKEIVCRNPYDFKVIYCQIEIEDREVKNWEQPLVQALGRAVFGIFSCVDDEIRKYLVRVRHEIGCFDSIELAPVVQMEPSNPRNRLDGIETLFFEKLNEKDGVITDVVLSEEGGRFYHEENENVIIEIEKKEITTLPGDVFWLDYSTISELIQFNNNVNIQLRNLLTLIDFV